MYSLAAIATLFSVLVPVILFICLCIAGYLLIKVPRYIQDVMRQNKDINNKLDKIIELLDEQKHSDDQEKKR